MYVVAAVLRCKRGGRAVINSWSDEGITRDRVPRGERETVRIVQIITASPNFSCMLCRRVPGIFDLKQSRIYPYSLAERPDLLIEERNIRFTRNSERRNAATIYSRFRIFSATLQSYRKNPILEIHVSLLHVYSRYNSSRPINHMVLINDSDRKYDF